MHIRMLRAKLHKAAVTHAALHYHGSVSIDEDILSAAGLHPFEIVTIANLSNGLRAETYVIKAPSGSKIVQANGAIARIAHPGDRLILLSFAYLEPSEIPGLRPKIVVLDEKNRIVEQFEGTSPPTTT
jgi:aspartate 1-decarboxylase